MKKRMLWLILLIAMASCSTLRKLDIHKEEEPVQTAELVGKINAERADIHTLKLERINIQVHTGNEVLRFNGFIGIIRDSMIMVSIVPAMGYEAARIFMFLDSTLIINRIEKNYLKDSNEKIRRHYHIPVSFRALENIFLNEFSPAIQLEAMRAKAMRSEIRDSLQYFAYLVEEGTDLYQVESMSSLKEGFIKLFNIKNLASGQYIRIEYGGFHRRGNKKFYDRINWKSYYNKRYLEGELDIRSYSINEEIRVQIRVPEKYTKKEI